MTSKKPSPCEKCPFVQASDAGILIRCAYYTKKGRFYCSGTGIYGPDMFVGLTRPQEYGELLRKLKSLPGVKDGKWGGYFVIDVGTYPDLVLPED